jgi:hypothetical protein
MTFKQSGITKIRKILFWVSLALLLISLYEVFSIGWTASKEFIVWSVIGGFSLVGVIVFK